MGEWKAQISVRVRQELRRELEEFAYADRRKLGNVAETLLEWAWEQLRASGSIERLLKFNIKPRSRTNGSAENRIGPSKRSMPKRTSITSATDFRACVFFATAWITTNQSGENPTSASEVNWPILGTESSQSATTQILKISLQRTPIFLVREISSRGRSNLAHPTSWLRSTQDA